MVYLWTAGFVLAVLFANLTLDQFIQLPVFGMLSIGTLFFGAVFTIRDRLHLYGLKAVYIAIALALIVNVFTGWIVMADDPNRLRFITASFIAILVSELTNTAIFQQLMGRQWITRALSSSAVSIPVDTILFTLMAFYGIMSWHEITQIVFADLVFKGLIALLVAIPIHFSLRRRHDTAAMAQDV